MSSWNRRCGPASRQIVRSRSIAPSPLSLYTGRCGPVPLVCAQRRIVVVMPRSRTIVSYPVNRRQPLRQPTRLARQPTQRHRSEPEASSSLQQGRSTPVLEYYLCKRAIPIEDTAQRYCRSIRDVVHLHQKRCMGVVSVQHRERLDGAKSYETPNSPMGSAGKAAATLLAGDGFARYSATSECSLCAMPGVAQRVH